MAQEEKETHKPEKLNQENQEIRSTEPLRIGNRFVGLGVLKSTCGTVHVIWVSPVARQLVGVFINLGLCSIEVTMAGVGNNQSVMIPSRAGLQGLQILVHPAATTATIKCLGGGPGDCTVVYLLVW